MHRPGILSTVAITAVILSTLISEKDAMASTGAKADVEKKLELVLERLKHKQVFLARPGPSEKAWAVGHVGLTLARGVAAEAQEQVAAGKFTEALSAVESCEKLLDASTDQAKLTRGGGVSVGTVLGHPYMGNKMAAYVWAKPEDGAGLMSIFDRERSRELLNPDPASAALWEVIVKEGDAETSVWSWDLIMERISTFSNQGRPCKVKFHADEVGGRMIFRWSKGITVEVEQRLGTEEALLRGRIEASTRPKGETRAKKKKTGPPETIMIVLFPVVTGIKPLTPDSSRDQILHTGKFGDLKPSPLASGKTPDYTSCPPAMQFTALFGDGQGLYFADHDGQGNRKLLTWTAYYGGAGAGTAYSEKADMPSTRPLAGQSDTGVDLLMLSIEHPVPGWGSDKPPREYRSPGDLVLGPFPGDWYDAARIYRKWALTAPWCAKGPIYERADYPKWFLEAPYWTFGNLGAEEGIEAALEKQAFYEVPTMISHVYNYYFPMHQDDRYPEYFPPRLGSVGLKEAVKRHQAKGIRIVPYVNGTLVDMDTDSFRMEHAEREGALWLTPDAEVNITTRYGGGASMMRMCPGSPHWRKQMLDDTRELIGRYGMDGIYVDFLTDHLLDCFNKAHGHAITGGNFWAKAVHDLYEEMQEVAKKLNPDFILTSEGVGEYCIDVHEVFFSNGTTGTAAPLFHAVYHGYSNIYGGIYGKTDPLHVGRWWLMGSQNGWHGGHLAAGTYYRDLLKCRWEFGTPYLGYGEMLRPPKIDSELPEVSSTSGYGTITVPAVEGSAWKAPDGTVGIFFLNYDDKNPYDINWSADLAETGLDKYKKLRMSRWTQASGLSPVKEVEGGKLAEKMRIEPLGTIALKLEVIE